METIYAVYLDAFLMENFLIDGLCLLGVKALARERRSYRFLWLFFGTLLGTVLGTMAFFFIHHFLLYQAVIFLAVQPLTVACALRPGNWRMFGKELLYCYVLYFLLGGILEFLAVYMEQAVYRLLPWAVILFTVSLLGLHFLEKQRKRYCRCTLIRGDKKAEARAIFDSGNLLRDPYTHRPVSIVSQSVKETLGIEKSSIRLIPYHTVAGRQELMEAATIPLMLLEIQGEAQKYTSVTVGFADREVFEGKPYGAILHREYDT